MDSGHFSDFSAQWIQPKSGPKLNATNDARVFLMTPFRKWTRELITYETLPEALVNGIFQSLPAGVKAFLSDLRARLRHR